MPGLGLLIGQITLVIGLEFVFADVGYSLVSFLVVWLYGFVICRKCCKSYIISSWFAEHKKTKKELKENETFPYTRRKCKLMFCCNYYFSITCLRIFMSICCLLCTM